MSIGSAYLEGFELAPLSGNLNQSYARNPGGTDSVCEDNDNNAFDFVLVSPSTPENFNSPVTPCAAPTQTITPTQTQTATATQPWPLSVVINEVAWGGTQADGSVGQWIELYNPRSTDIVIDGWHLIAADGVPDIPLAGTILAGDYFILARNYFSPDVAVDLLWMDPLEATGEALSLVRADGTVVDTVNLNGGPWPGGSGFLPSGGQVLPYASMERIGVFPEDDLVWVTFDGTPVVGDPIDNGFPGAFINGTPRRVNWANGFFPTPSPTATSTATATVTATATITPTRTITPTLPASRAIVINEVAWMGTKADSNDEWIELYNPGSTDIDLTGWKIEGRSSGSTLSFTINLNSVTLAAGSYYLLEQDDDTAVKDVPANQIITTTNMSDSGLSLTLKSSNGTTIDTANSDYGAWPAGNTTTDCTMERYSKSGVVQLDATASWITNTGVLKNGIDVADNPICGTPKNANWASIVTPTPSPVRQATATRSSSSARTPTPRPVIVPVVVSSVVINEFLPQARSDWNNDGSIDAGDEFIELINLSTQAMAITGWQLDDQDGDSPPYVIQDTTLQPGARKTFFASQTGLLLSNAGDSVRLFKSSGQVSDAYTYPSVRIPDQSWCRLPDGKPTWVSGCAPTVDAVNKLAESIFFGDRNLPAMCLSPNLPGGVYQAECTPAGLEMWSPALWGGDPLLYPRIIEWADSLFFFE